MARSKSKKKKLSKFVETDQVDEVEIPIENLPDKYLWMKVKSGTKFRNILEYALKEFASYDTIIWSGSGQAIGKVISCAEIFKRKISDLHQITKLRYVHSKTVEQISKTEDSSEGPVVPEIHILLSKNVLNIHEPGYQAPGICSMFQDSKINEKSTESHEKPGSTKTRMSDATAVEFASMGLRTGQKRRHQSRSQTPTKKIKNLDINND